MFHNILKYLSQYFWMFSQYFLMFAKNVSWNQSGTSVAFKSLNGLNAEPLEAHNFGKTFIKVRIRRENCSEFVETVLDEAVSAPTPSNTLIRTVYEGRRPWQAQKWRVGCCFEQDREITVFNFHQSSGLSQRQGQALLDMFGHWGIRSSTSKMWRAPPSCSCSCDLRGPARKVLCALATYWSQDSQETEIRDWIRWFAIIWRCSRKLCSIHGGWSISTSRFALVSMLRVANNRAAVFFRFPAGLNGIARQELWMKRTSSIVKFSPVCGRHHPQVALVSNREYWTHYYLLQTCNNR